MKKSYIYPEIDFVDMATEGYHEESLSTSETPAADSHGVNDIETSGAFLSKDRNVDFSEDGDWGF